jgi:hypothetical protein
LPIVKNRTKFFGSLGTRLEHQIVSASFCAMQQFTPSSEWSAPSVKLEDFVLGDAWQNLPFEIQVALAHIWLGEQEPKQRALHVRKGIAATGPVGSQARTGPNSSEPARFA